MAQYRFTQYFDQEVLRKRSYISRERCIYAIEHALRVERQEDNRIRYWASIPELDGRFLRVITLEDRTTIHNAFLDRGFKP